MPGNKPETKTIADGPSDSRPELGHHSASDATTLKLLLEAVDDAAYLFDAVIDDSGEVGDFTFRFMNHAAEILLGRSRESLVGSKLCELYPLHRGTSLFDDYAHVYKEGHSLRRVIEVPDLATGTRWYEQRVLPTATGIAIASRDVTREKAFERARKEIEERAQQAQHLESLGMLAGGVAHDFNNLLLAIAGFTTVATLAADEAQDDLHHALEQIRNATKRAAHLTRQLLGLGGGGRYAQQLVDFNDVLSSGLGLLSNVLSPTVRLKTRLTSDDVFLLGDDTQLLQVLVNLSVNARDAMPDGGELEISTEKVVVDDTRRLCPGQPPATYVRLTVRDTGVGMDDMTRQRIFEPFFTTKSAGEGIGLGLALVYSIVERHGGFVAVRSALGEGTTFTIDFPIRVSVRPPAEDDAREASAYKAGETVLVVDRDGAIRVLVGAALSRDGYRVLFAASGQEALDVVRRCGGEINLVLVDSVVSEVHGRQAHDELRLLNPNVRVLLCSSSEEGDGGLAPTEGGGAPPVLRKPFDIATLLKSVRAAIDGG